MRRRHFLVCLNILFICLYGFSFRSAIYPVANAQAIAEVATIISNLKPTDAPHPSPSFTAALSSTAPPTLAPIPVDTVLPVSATTNNTGAKIDWSLMIAVISLVLTVLTLYFAHLRGPSISVAIPNDVYPLHGLHTQTLRPVPKKSSGGHYVILSNLRVANTGISSGVLYSFRVDPNDSAVFHYELHPHPDRELPTTIPPGESWKTTLSVQISSGQRSGVEFAESKQTINMKVSYLASASLGRKIRREIDLKISLAPLTESVRAAARNSKN
jgi:hypothetical protein